MRTHNGNITEIYEEYTIDSVAKLCGKRTNMPLKPSGSR